MILRFWLLILSASLINASDNTTTTSDRDRRQISIHYAGPGPFGSIPKRTPASTSHIKHGLGHFSLPGGR